MAKRKLFAFSSGGNDSVAVLQLLHEHGWAEECEVLVGYSDTGWAKPGWSDRIEAVAAWCAERGMSHHTIPSKGFGQLVLDGDAGTIHFPNGMRKTCTERLKQIPGCKWMDTLDPDKNGVAVVGLRRCESLRRANAEVYVPSSSYHGGRALWHPLAEYSDEQRDELLARAGIEVLAHRSDECFPCIHANRPDLRRLDDEAVSRVRALEDATGKVMFRPKGYAGAVGIDEVMRWAWSDRGQYKPEDAAIETALAEDAAFGCESGLCGA